MFLLSTEGGGAVAACSSTPVPDVEPVSVGVYDDAILQQLDDFLLMVGDAFDACSGAPAAVGFRGRYDVTSPSLALPPLLVPPSP